MHPQLEAVALILASLNTCKRAWHREMPQWLCLLPLLVKVLCGYNTASFVPSPYFHYEFHSEGNRAWWHWGVDSVDLGCMKWCSTNQITKSFMWQCQHGAMGSKIQWRQRNPGIIADGRIQEISLYIRRHTGSAQILPRQFFTIHCLLAHMAQSDPWLHTIYLCSSGLGHMCAGDHRS